MDLKLPKLGEGADSGIVVGILVREGDVVREGQTLLELENEKAVAPIPATTSGVVSRIRVKEGDKVTVGQVLLSLDSTGAEVRPEPTTTAPAEPVPASGSRTAASHVAEAQNLDALEAEIPARSEAAVAAAPSIRRLALELGLDLTRVRGSAAGGRIVMADLRAYVQRLQKLASQPARVADTPAVPKAAPAEVVDFTRWGPVTKKPLSQLRKVIGQRMSESWSHVPRVTQFDEADITALMDLRKKHQAAYEAKGARLTLTPLAMKAAAIALKKHPIFNSSLDEATGEIVFKEYFHLGLAVDTEAGLLVPVVRDVNRKSLLEIAREVEELAGRARARKLSLDEMKGGTFTISNQGGIGGGHFTPIVNRPEVAILGLGRGTMKAVVKEKQIVPRLMLPVAVSYDHRLIDGGVAARFTVDLVQALENFSESEVTL